jgi:ATP-dependent DNA ligase
MSLSAWSFSSLPAATWQIRGQYLEARTCDVFTGPCFANGEMGMAGKEAVLGWKVSDGSWNGVPLSGLTVALVLKGDNTLGDDGVFPMATRKKLFDELQPWVTTFDGHPWNWAAHEEGERTPRKNETSRWNAGKDLSFVPLRPEKVVEVRYDYMEGVRFRHTAQFVRWRPDRDPESCTYEQLERPVRFNLADVLASG